ncbi:hypothetical protein [Aquimarina sediminis]|uniref:hypothetical protein n=1 Tax=Aquimarina sediminis TaxID=2070536 RepID=UPI000CA04BDC|nr:hypothetical protein [Aquimarina sediminis]
MITHEEKIIQNVVRQFDGMLKIEVYDILYKIESLLSGFSSPIQFKQIKKSIDNTIDKEHFIAIDAYGYCYLEDECQYLKVFRIKSLLPVCLGGELLYFTTPGQYELTSYTNQNLEETFSNMHLQTIIAQFLKYNNAKKRNPKTRRLLLLELLDQIDPE